MTEKGEPKRVLKFENGPSDGVAPGGVDTGIRENNWARERHRHWWCRSRYPICTYYDEVNEDGMGFTPRSNQSCHPLMRRVHVGPSVIIVYTIVVIFQFLLATKIVPGKEAGSKEARKRK